MKTLRLVLSPTPAFYAARLVYLASWDARVQEFRDTFTGTPWRNVGSPVTSGSLTFRAVVYLEAPDNVSESQLDFLRREWSKRQTGVQVDSVEFVNGVQPAANDRTALEDASPLGKAFGKLGDTGEMLLRVAVVTAVVVGGLWVLKRVEGTKEW